MCPKGPDSVLGSSRTPNCTSTLQPRSVPCGSPGTPQAALASLLIPDQCLPFPCSPAPPRQQQGKTQFLYSQDPSSKGLSPAEVRFRLTDSLSNQWLQKDCQSEEEAGSSRNQRASSEQLGKFQRLGVLLSDLTAEY